MTEEVKKLMTEALQHQVGPSFICGVVLLLLARSIYRNRFSHFAAVLAFVGSLAVGNWLAQINPDWWPALNASKRATWLPWMAAAGCVAGLISQSMKKPVLGYAFWVAVAYLFADRIVPENYLKYQCWAKMIPEGFFQTKLWAASGLLFLTALVGFGFAKLNGKRPGGLPPFLFGFALLTAGTVAIFSKAPMTLLDLNTLGGFCLYGLAAVAPFTKADVSSIYPGAAFLLTGSLLVAHYDSESNIPEIAFLLPAIAPLFALVGLLPFVDRQRSLIRVLIVAGPMLIALGIALALATTYGELPLGSEKDEW